MRICFFGSPSEVIPLLETLSKHCELVAVVTQPAKPCGRGKVLTDPPVAQYAKFKGLKIMQPISAKSPEFLAELQSFKPDLCITAAYGQILSDEFLKIPTRGTINIHPSQLPQYRGATPVPSALLNGDKQTGVSILFTVKKLDAGAIILQQKFAIKDDETAGELTSRLFKESGKLLTTAIEKLEDKSFGGIAQNEKEVSHCKKITKADGEINWNDPAEKIFNQYRAYTPWPGVFTFSQEKKRFIFGKITFSKEDLNTPQGTCFFHENRLMVSCGRGSIEIHSLQPEGKKMVASHTLLNGQFKAFFQSKEEKSSS